MKLTLTTDTGEVIEEWLQVEEYLTGRNRGLSERLLGGEVLQCVEKSYVQDTAGNEKLDSGDRPCPICKRWHHK